MRIIPTGPISINNVHAPAGVPVDVIDEKLARELLAIGAATLAPPAPTVVEPSVPIAVPEAIETAAIAPAQETAVRQTARPRKVGR